MIVEFHLIMEFLNLGKLHGEMLKSNSNEYDNDYANAIYDFVKYQKTNEDIGGVYRSKYYKFDKTMEIDFCSADMIKNFKCDANSVLYIIIDNVKKVMPYTNIKICVESNGDGYVSYDLYYYNNVKRNVIRDVIENQSGLKYTGGVVEFI